MEKKDLIKAILMIVLGALLYVLYFNILTLTTIFLSVLGVSLSSSFIVCGILLLANQYLDYDKRAVLGLVPICIYSLYFVGANIYILVLTGFNTSTSEMTRVIILAFFAIIVCLTFAIVSFIAVILKRETLTIVSIILGSLFAVYLILDLMTYNGYFIPIANLNVFKLITYGIMIYLLVDGFIGLKENSY